MDTLATMVDAALAIEKLRVASEVRQTHIFLNGVKLLLEKGKITKKEAEELKGTWAKKRTYPIELKQYLSDSETDELHSRQIDLENYVDGRVAVLIKEHPAYHWFSRVKGVGRENIGKVVGKIRVKLDPEHPPRSKDKPNWADTISALWKFTGWAPVDGHSMKRVKGEKLEYNSQLRSMCWRLASSLKRAGGCFYEYYSEQKEIYRQRFLDKGYKVLPTPAGRWVCANCGQSWVKKGDIVPCCDNQNIVKKLKEEPPGVIWLGHLDMLAMRKMIKLFLACLWLVWRESEGLPVSSPYAIGELGHTHFIDPWEMVDKAKRKE